MDTFEFFKEKLDNEISHSVRAQLWFQEPFYDGDYLDFDGLQVWCGITRATLADSGWNYVAKFTYSEDKRGDACDRECTFYENAVDSGVEMYFAEPKYIGRYEWRGEGYCARKVFREINVDFNDEDSVVESDIEEYGCGIEKKETISIYLYLYEYPRARLIDRFYYTPSKEIADRVRKSGSGFALQNTNVAAFFVEKYGYDEFLKIADFLEWNGINDLHSGNIGYLGEQLVFIDYAGYYDPEEDYGTD